MREIKFRSWERQKMDYDPTFLGEYTYYGDGDSNGDSMSLNLLLKEEWGILMQYTGLKDKNGREIYEGDIVERDGNVGVVQVEDWLEVYVEQVKENPEAIVWDDMVRDLYRIEEMEVIGNIYENPELANV